MDCRFHMKLLNAQFYALHHLPCASALRDKSKLRMHNCTAVVKVDRPATTCHDTPHSASHDINTNF